MSRKRKTSHLRANRPPAGRVAQRTFPPGDRHAPFEIDLNDDLPEGMVPALFKRFGVWILPIPFLEWLDSSDLIQQFDDYACTGRESRIHGDAITAFLRDHGASDPLINDVQEILSRAN